MNDRCSAPPRRSGRAEGVRGDGGGEVEALATELIVHHYDPAYRRQGQIRARPELAVVGIDSLADAALERAADQIAVAADAFGPA